MTPFSYTPGIIDGGGDGASDLFVTGSGNVTAPGGPGPGIADYFDVGKSAVKYLAPDLYGDATSWLPDVGGWLDGALSGGGEMGFMDSAAFGGGEAAGGASGFSGAAAAFMPAAAFYAWAQLMSALNQNTDHPITLGAGYTDLEAGFTDPWGPKANEAAALGDLYLGDRSWYEGGDTSLATPRDTAIGSMSWKESLPAYTVGGAPYQTPGLAAESGRQITRGQMGLPVEYEPLGNAYSPIGADAAMQGQFFANASLPVYDAPADLPTDWDNWMDMRNQFGTGEGQQVSSPAYDEFYGGLNDRQREFADAGLKTSAMWKYTGENSPDYGAVLDDLSSIQGSMSQLSPSGIATPGYNWGTY